MSQTITYYVPGMSCGHCRAAIIDEVTAVPGVDGVDVDLETKLVRVNGSDLDDAALVGAIGDAGYAAERLLEHAHGEPERRTSEDPAHSDVAELDDDEHARAAEAARVELEEQLRQAQKMETLGRLAGGVVHDFNNLLQLVRGHAQLALSSEDASYIRTHVRELLEVTTRAALLTSQLLTFSRKQPFQVSPIDLSEIVREMEGMLRRLIGVNVELVTSVAREPCLIGCDPTQIQQVLLNLVINARDAMPHGGRLTIDSRVDERPDGRYGVLVVTDTGEGMDSATLEHAFEPFFTTKEVGKGTGLGLSTVGGAVDRCGGELEVRSAVGEGTRFEVAFPELKGRAMPEPAESQRPRTRGSETVLLVDDDDRIRALTAEYLHAQGYSVLAVGSAREAIDLFERGHIDVLVTDAVMPHMGGYELYRRLVELQPQLPVVYMSGYDPADLPEATPNSAFLQKPHDLDKLAETVRTLVEMAA